MGKGSVSGILNLNKPVGKTSHQVVNEVRRASGTRRVGHAGTLDPIACGVLPVCIGQATRIIEFLESQRKVYLAEIKMGVSTDTYDAEGKVTEVHDVSSLTQERIEEELRQFRGNIEQTPPMFSAIKHQGTPLYRLARRGLDVQRMKRKVMIYRLDLLEWHSPLLTVEVECSKGTYIRSLAHDIGQSLGCGAHLQGLIRLRNGIFDISDSMTIEEMRDAFQQGYWQALVYPLDVAVLDWNAIIVGSNNEQAIRHGKYISFGELTAIHSEQRTSPPSRADNGVPTHPDCNRDAIPTPRDAEGIGIGARSCRAYSSEGTIVGLLRQLPDEELWHPFKVFSVEG